MFKAMILVCHSLTGECAENFSVPSFDTLEACEVWVERVGIPLIQPPHVLQEGPTCQAMV